MNHFVYVPGLVGIETELECFRWNFGYYPPVADKSEFEKCAAKIYLKVVPDKKIAYAGAEEGVSSFRRFSAHPEAGDLYFSQRMFKLFNARFALHVKGNDIYAEVGKSYFKKIRYKVMNVHPIWYVLFDLTTYLLIGNGYLPVYASAVVKDGRATLIMGPPGSGKTLTALSLSMKHGFRLMSEDLVVTDGERIWPAPWTQTYRDYGKEYEDFIKTAEKPLDPAPAERLFLIERGTGTERDPFDKMSILNRYDIGYPGSPVLLALSYFNGDVSLKRAEETERCILKKLFENVSVFSVSSCNADHSDVIADAIK